MFTAQYGGIVGREPNSQNVHELLKKATFEMTIRGTLIGTFHMSR